MFENFLSVCKDVTKTTRKIPQGEYLSDGTYKIFDQGKNYIGGYCNTANGVASDYPYIVFGDHTRVIKYINEPCYIGADGVKLLKVYNNDFIPKFVYYAMLANPVEHQGYSRHFKLLKETKIRKYDKSIQNTIIDELDKINLAISLKESILNHLDELVKSRFIEMFGNPDANEKEWEKSKLENFINVVGGYAFKSQKYLSEGIPVLRIGNINAGYFKDTNLVFYQEDSALEKYKIYPNDLVISLTGTAGKDDYGNICLIDSTYDVYYLNQRNAKIEIKHTFNRFFLMHLFSHPEIKQRLTGKNHGIRQGNILNKDILELDVYVPPIELQNEFADFVKLIDKSKFIVQKQIDDLQELLDSKMDEYFG